MEHPPYNMTGSSRKRKSESTHGTSGFLDVIQLIDSSGRESCHPTKRVTKCGDFVIEMIGKVAEYIRFG